MADFTSSQLGDGSVEDEDASQQAADWSAVSESQPAADASSGGGPRVRFDLVSGLVDAPKLFTLPVEHRSKVYLGRTGGGAALPSGSSFVTLTSQPVATGLSRNHGWLEFDKFKGVVFTDASDKKAGLPSFLNGIALADKSPPVVLNAGDTLGFGGSSALRPTEGTSTYRVCLSDMPPLAQPMPPPPPRPPIGASAGGGSSGAAVPAPSAAGSSRERGERGGARHKKRAREEGTSASAAPAGAVPVLQTLASVAQAHAAATQGLGAEERRWGQRMLACTAQCYTLVQTAVAEGGSLLNTMEQVQHKVSSLLGDMRRSAAAATAAARTAAAQHARHDRRSGAKHSRGGAGKGRGGRSERGTARGRGRR